MSEQLSADEIALYDRQIRLWGTSTQLKLRSTKILVINLGAIGSEIVKNLVLGGINTIEILDNSTIQPQDFAAQFFYPIMMQKLMKMVMEVVEMRVHILDN